MSYDDLLGPRKKKKTLVDTITNIIVPKNNKKKTVIKTVSYITADVPTGNGHVYTRKVLEDALKFALGNGNGVLGNLWLTNGGTPNDPAMVDVSKIIGKCIAFKIDKGGKILLQIEYRGGSSPYSVFDITLCCIGKADSKGIVSDLIITQLYIPLRVPTGKHAGAVKKMGTAPKVKSPKVSFNVPLNYDPNLWFAPAGFTRGKISL